MQELNEAETPSAAVDETPVESVDQSLSEDSGAPVEEATQTPEDSMTESGAALPECPPGSEANMDGDGLTGGDMTGPPDCIPSYLTEVEEAVLQPTTSMWTPVIEIIEAGGPVIIILAILSVISIAIALVKIIQFTLLKVGDKGFVPKVAERMRNGDTKGALDMLTRRRSVIARVMEAAVRGKLLGADEAQLKEEVTRVAQSKLDGLERGIPFLSLIATISPLLGLLGTVLGMIDAFQQLEEAGDRVDPAILSGGIWEALLTTAAGLSVAIPAAAFYTWLQRTVDVAAQRMEDAATQVFTAALYNKHDAVPAKDDE